MVDYVPAGYLIEVFPYGVEQPHKKWGVLCIARKSYARQVYFHDTIERTSYGLHIINEVSKNVHKPQFLDLLFT